MACNRDERKMNNLICLKHTYVELNQSDSDLKSREIIARWLQIRPEILCRRLIQWHGRGEQISLFT